jgi:hypothetical protein
METNEKLETETGTIEKKSLEAKPVLILSVDIREQTNKEGKVVGDKVICLSKHPDREDPIEISTLSYLKNKSVKTSGLWFNLDEENKIAKDSALGAFLGFCEVKTISQLKELQLETELDDAGYLCFKAY